MNNYITGTAIDALWTCLILAVAASSIAVTITHAKIFDPLRRWAAARLPTMLAYLFTCFYCMSHWIVFAGVILYRPVLVESNYLIADLTVSAFFTITLSTFISGLMAQSFLSFMNMKLRDMEIKDASEK